MRLLHRCLAALALLVLAACAQGSHSPYGSYGSFGPYAVHDRQDEIRALADVATESDETPQRRRARLRLELGAAYLQEGQPQVALDEVKQAIAIDPRYADAFTLRGLAYLRMNNSAMAGDSFERAVLLNPRDANAAHNLGLLRCQQARFDDAARYFSRAFVNADYAAQPRHWVAYSLCQANAGKPLLAEASLARALSLDAAEPTASYHLARLLLARGDAEAARGHVLQLNNGPASNASSLWLGIRIEQQLNNVEGVRALADRLRTQFGQSREMSAFNRGAFDE